jgi:hypothetical protein
MTPIFSIGRVLVNGNLDEGAATHCCPSFLRPRPQDKRSEFSRGLLRHASLYHGGHGGQRGKSQAGPGPAVLKTGQLREFLCPSDSCRHWRLQSRAGAIRESGATHAALSSCPETCRHRDPRVTLGICGHVVGDAQQRDAVGATLGSYSEVRELNWSQMPDLEPNRSLKH